MGAAVPAREEDAESYADSFESDDGEEGENGDEPADNEAEAAANAAGTDIGRGNGSVDGEEDLSDQDDSDDESSEQASVDVQRCSRPRVRTKGVKRERERQTLIYYDQHTYMVISRLRALNKRLSQQLEQQNKLVTTLAEEKKQTLLLIDSLRLEVQMHKQTVRAIRPTTSNGGKSDPRTASLPAMPRPPTQPTSPRDERGNNSRATTPRFGIQRRPVSPASPSLRKNQRVKTPGAVQEAQGCICGGRSQDAHLVEMYTLKLEKAEEERKDLQQRHAHQLANYSHELSRLERLLEKAHTVVQEKDNELRLQRTRQLYCSTPATPSSAVITHRRNSNAGIVVPLTVPRGDVRAYR